MALLEERRVGLPVLPPVECYRELRGCAIVLKTHRMIVPSPSAVQTKCGTCPGTTDECLSYVCRELASQIIRKVVKTKVRDHAHSMTVRQEGFT